MTRKYFGTDGIRGRTNTAKLTPEVALKAGMGPGASSPMATTDIGW